MGDREWHDGRRITIGNLMCDWCVAWPSVATEVTHSVQVLSTKCYIIIACIPISGKHLPDFVNAGCNCDRRPPILIHESAPSENLKK